MFTRTIIPENMRFQIQLQSPSETFVLQRHIIRPGSNIRIEIHQEYPDKKRVGSINLNCLANVPVDLYFLDNIFIGPSEDKRDLSLLLVYFAIQEIRINGGASLYLTTPSTPDAFRFYEHYGFYISPAPFLAQKEMIDAQMEAQLDREGIYDPVERRNRTYRRQYDATQSAKHLQWAGNVAHVHGIMHPAVSKKLKNIANYKTISPSMPSDTYSIQM